MDNYDNEYIMYHDLHEAIEEAKRRLDYLESDSYDRLRIILGRDDSIQPDLYIDVQYSIVIAKHVKCVIQSILHIYSTLNPTPIPTDLIPFINDIRPRLIRLVLRFNSLKKTYMKEYVTGTMYRLDQATSLLMRATSFAVIDSYSSDHDQDWENMMIMVNKVVKERSEEIIKVEKSMEEFEQVLFELYVMVEKKFRQVVVINGSAIEVHKNVEALVQGDKELRWKKECAFFKRLCIKSILSVFVLYSILSYLFPDAGPLPSGSTKN